MSACDQIDTILSKNGFSTIPSARRRITVDRVSQSRGQPGYDVTVDTTSLAAQLVDFAGRNAHLIGIRLETAIVTSAASAEIAESAHSLHGSIYNYKLQGQDGHVYWQNLDGRDLLFDGWARAGRVANSPPLAPDYNPDVAVGATQGSLLYPYPAPTVGNPFAMPVDAGAVYVRDISQDISLIGEHGMAGLIPLADILNNNGTLQFKLRTTTPGGNFIKAFEVQGQNQIAIRVVFDVLYIPGIQTGRRFIVDDYTVTVADGPFKYPGFRHSYIGFRWREEDIGDASGAYGALTNADHITNLQVLLGATSEVQGLTATELRARLRMLLERYPNGEINTWDRQGALPAFTVLASTTGNPLLNGQPTAGGDYLTRLCDFAIPYAPRAKNRPAGAISYSVDPTSIPSGGLMRIIHRVEGELSQAPIDAARACGCRMASNAVTVMTDDKGNELLTTNTPNRVISNSK